jgi:hypothetical protein
VTTRGRVARALTGLGLAGAVILALVSCLVLHGWVLVWVGVAAALAAWVAYGARHTSRAAAVAAAGRAAAGAVGSIMIVTGAEVVGGAVMVEMVLGLGVVVGGAVWLPRGIRARSVPRHGSGAAAAGAGASSGARMPIAALLDRSSTPVSLMATLTLGREWSRTSVALTTRLEPAARQAVVQRRQQVLDELERRDPAGFARWLVAAPDGDNDPAGFVRGGRIRGGDTA